MPIPYKHVEKHGPTSLKIKRNLSQTKLGLIQTLKLAHQDFKTTAINMIHNKQLKERPKNERLGNP